MTTSMSPDQLPAVVRTYLDAQDARDTATALPTFAPDAVVTDQGETFAGTDSLRGFLDHAGAEFTYTTTVTGARREADGTWVATQRLEGDFPGGVAELDLRFTVEDDLIVRLDYVPA
jgi:ketosteroid isomerase-like protein